MNWTITQVSGLPVTHQPRCRASSGRTGDAGLLSPFLLQSGCVLVCSVDEEFKVKAAFVLQHEGAGFPAALHHGTEVDERGGVNAVLAEHSFRRHPHWDDGDGLASSADAGLHHLQPEEGLVKPAKRPASDSVP